MKKLFTILLLAFSFFSQAQTIQYLGSPTTQIYVRGQMRIDTVVYLPLRDTTFTPSQIGAFIVKGIQPYIWIGTKWVQMTTGSPLWGQIQGTLSSQTDLQTALNAKQNTMSAGYGIKISTNTILFDSANLRKVDTIFRLNDSTINFTINGVAHSVLVRGTAAGGITSLVLNVPTALLTNPITFSHTGGAWSGTMALANQNANTVFGGPVIGSPGQPGFRALVIADLPTGIPNGNLQNSSITYGVGTAGSNINISPSTVALGGTVTVNIPNGGPSTRGAITAADWNAFNNKVTSVNGQGGVVITKNADSIVSLPVDTTTNRNNYVLTFDSTAHKWKLTANNASSLNTDSLTPTFLPYWDAANMFKNSPLSTTDGLVAIRGNTVLYFGGVGPHGSSYASFADTAGVQVYNVGEETAITGAGTPQDFLFFQGVNTAKTHFNQGSTDNFTISNGSIRPFVGTAGTRTASPSPGDVYWDTDTLCLVAYNGSAWHSLCSGGLFGKEDVKAFENRYFNANNFDFSIDSAKNIFLHGVTANGDTRVSLEDTVTSIYASAGGNASVLAVTPNTILAQPKGFGSHANGEVLTLIDNASGRVDYRPTVSAQDLQSVTDVGKTTTNVITAAGYIAAQDDFGMRFNLDEAGNFIAAGYGANIQFNRTTGQLLLQPSFTSGSAGGTPSYTSANLTLKPAGNAQLGNYGSGTFTGLKAYGLAVTSTGNIIEDTTSAAIDSAVYFRMIDAAGIDPYYASTAGINTTLSFRKFRDSVGALRLVQNGDSSITGYVDLSGKQPVGNYITALTGDVVAAGPGSVPATIQANAVTTAKINNSAVTYAKIQAATAQSLLGATGASNFQEITLGTNLSMAGTVLNAAGTSAAGVFGSVQIKSATTGTFGNAKNITADSTTGKLYADTTSVHTSRTDSVKVNYVNSWPFPSIQEAYGHSMVQGQAATLKFFIFNAVQPFPDSTWRNRFATRLNLPDYNHGYSGTGPMDAAMFGIKYQDPANRALTFVMDGWNAIQNTTPVVPNTYNKIINSNKYLWVNVNLKRYKGAGITDSVTTYGTWINYTNTATAASPSAQLSVPLTETKSGSAKQTSTINDSIVWISPVDTGFVAEVLGWKSSGSTIQIYVDNVLSRTVNTNGQTDSINTDIFVLGKVTMPIVFTGLSMASHRVKIINTTAGKLVVDFFGNLRDARYSYPFIIVHDPDHGGTKTNIVTNNGKQDSLVAAIQAIGYPAITFPTNSYINGSTDIAADSIHPNNSGMRHMDSGLNIVYTSHTPQGEVGTLTMSNALHERYADVPYAYRKLVTTADINRVYSSVPDVFTQDQYIYMSAHNLNITDSASGHFVRAPNYSISDSSSNTYFYWNARNRFTDNATGLRVFSSAPASIPDFFLIGFNSSTFGGSTTSSKPGFAFAFDARDVTGTMRFLTHPVGTVTDVVCAGIHQSGGWEFGSTFNNTDDLKAWVRVTRGTTTRTGFILDSTVLLTTPTKGSIENTGDSICWTDRNNSRKRLATTDLIPTGSVLSVAGNDVAAQTAYGTITTYAVPADGVYEVSGYLIVNSISVDQIKLTVNFTDHNNTGRALDMFPVGTTTALTALTGYYSYVSMTFKAKSGTNIVIASDGTTGGSINFDAGSTIKKIR